MELTKTQLIEVKRILDGASWDGEVGHPDRYPTGGYRVCCYLNHQRFSCKTIKSHVKELDESDVLDYANNQAEYIPEACAILIADNVASERIRRYLYKENGKPGNGWWLPESWVFKLANLM